MLAANADMQPMNTNPGLYLPESSIATKNVLSPSSANHIEASGVESVLHANTVPIGSECLELELEWANENGVPYYYLGSGYEKSSEYKAKWSGFQWWTGVQWSRNKRQYRRLCRRDSRVNDFSALGKFSLIPDSP